MKTALTIIGGATLALLGYAVYFDYKRRNDPTFRRKLKKQKEEIERRKEEQRKSAEEMAIKLLKSALDIVKDAKYPASMEDREKFFTENLQNGENLMKTDPEKFDEIAACFFKAVKVYPNPVDLLVILQKSLPEDITSLVYAMISTEEQATAEIYYEELTERFPTIDIKPLCEEDSSALKRGVFATVTFKENEVIYTEDPVITALTLPAIKERDHCHYCLSPIPEEVICDPDQMVASEDGYTVFQSTICQQRANADFMKSFVAKDSNPDALKNVYAYCLDKKTMYPLMVARFMAKMITKQMNDTRKQKERTIAIEWEHLERLPQADLQRLSDDGEKERDLICDSLCGIAPAIGEFLTVERYLSIKAAIVGNVVGIHSVEESKKYAVNALEPIRPRTSVDYAKVHSAGLYFVSAYIQHSDEPNAYLEFVFPHSQKVRKSNLPSPKLVLKSLKPILEGEQITISHVPVAVKETPSADMVGK